MQNGELSDNEHFDVDRVQPCQFPHGGKNGISHESDTLLHSPLNPVYT